MQEIILVAKRLCGVTWTRTTVTCKQALCQLSYNPFLQTMNSIKPRSRKMFFLGDFFHFPGIEFWTRKQRQNSTQNKATMVNRPPPPFIINGRHPERPPRRPAQSISSADSGERSVAARWSLAARGLSSSRFAVADTCFCTVWGRILEVPRQSTG